MAQRGVAYLGVTGSLGSGWQRKSSMRVPWSSDPLFAAPLETRNCDFWKCRDFDQSANTRKSKTTMPEPRERYLDGEYGVGPCVGVERSDGFYANDLKCFFHLKVSDTPHDLEVFSSPAI